MSTRTCPCCGRIYTRDECRQLEFAGVVDGNEYWTCIEPDCGSTFMVPDGYWAAQELAVVLNAGPFEHLADARPREWL